MPAAAKSERRRRKRPKVILEAALTIDGKLEAVPPVARDASLTVVVWEDHDGQLAADPLGQLLALPKAVRRVICLGPAPTFRALLDAGVVDELELTVGPRVDGRRDAATLSGPPGAAWFPASIACRLLRVAMRGGECRLRYRVE